MASSLVFRRALLRGSRFVGSLIALRRRLRIARRLGLPVADQLGLWLRIADRLGQHLMQLGLGALWRSPVGGFCHSLLAAICRRTSPLPSPNAQPSIVRNFFGRHPALLRIPFSFYRRAGPFFQPLVARGLCLFYRS